MSKPIQRNPGVKLGMTQIFDENDGLQRLPWYRRAPVWFKKKTGKRMVMMRYRSVSGGQGKNINKPLKGIFQGRCKASQVYQGIQSRNYR